MRLMKLCAFMCALSLTIAGCGGTSSSGGGGGGSSDNATVYSGPGSFYEFTRNSDGSFQIQVAEEYGGEFFLTVQGSIDVLDTGFLKLTVESVDGTDGPEVGETAVAIEIPGFALLLKPTTGDEIIPMLIGGDCPTGDFTANWFIAQNTEEKDASDANNDFWGGFQLVDNVPSLTGKYNLSALDTVSGGEDSFGEVTCDEGFLQIEQEGVDSFANLWLTSNGGAMVETVENGERLSTILALPKESVSFSSLAGDYAALILMGSADAENPIFPGVLTLNDDGTATGAEVSDIETGDTVGDAAEFAFNAANDPENGQFTGTIDVGGDMGNIACAATENIGDDNQDVIICVAQDPGDNTKSFIIMAASIP